MTRPALHRFLPALVILFLTLAGGCSRQSKINRHLKTADAFFAADQYNLAEIEYLNVMRLDATNKTAIRNLGAIYYADEQMIRSLAFLNTLKQMDPADFESRGKLSRLYFAAGAIKEARDEATLVLQSSPTNETALLVLIDAFSKPEELNEIRQIVGALQQKAGQKALFHVASGYVSLREGDQRAAENAFKAGLTVDPKSALPHWALGNLYLAQTNVALAEPALKTASDLSPLRSSRRLKYITLKHQLGDAPTSKTLLSEVNTKAPDYLPAWILSARFAMIEKNLEKCASDLERVLSRVPDNFDALSLRSEMHMAAGKMDKAVADLEKLTTRYPKTPTAHYQHAVARLLNRDMLGAIASLTQTLALEPNFDAASLMLAELNTRKGETASAIAAMTSYIKKQPNNEKAYLILASAYQAAGRSPEAIATYTQAIKNFTNSIQAPILLGVFYRQQGNEAEARKIFEKILQTRPEDLTATTQLIDIDIGAKNFDSAINRVQPWIDRAPKDPEPLLQMARIRFAQNDLKAAEGLLDKVIEMSPDIIPAYLMLSRVYLQSGQVDSALQKAELALTKNPKNASALLLSAMILGEKKDYPKARDAYEKLLAVSPNSLVGLNNLAGIYADHLDQLDKAYTLARRAEELRPNDPTIADTFGWILARRGEFGLALGLIKDSAQKRPRDAEIVAHLGLTHYLMGDEAPARVALEQSLKLSPAFFDRPAAEKALAIININPAAIDAKTAAELEKRLAEKPADPVALARATAVYKRAGQIDRIIAAYERALVANPKMATAMAKLAELYAESANNQGKALDLAKNARKLAPADPAIGHSAGRVALRSSDINEQQWALSLLQESNQKQNNNPEVLYDLALAHYSQGRLSDAENFMKTAIACGPNSPIAPSARRFLEFLPLNSNSARAVQGLAKAEEALKSDPNYAPALVTRALALEQKDPPSALKAYDRVLARYPGFAPAIRSSSLLLAAQPGDNTKALTLLTKARELYPNDVEVAKALGSVLYKRGEFAKAVRHLSESGKKLPNDAPLQFMLGMTHYQLKQPQESKTALRQALALQADAPFAADAKRILAELK